jgi:hypothetical protein
MVRALRELLASVSQTFGHTDGLRLRQNLEI